MNNLQSLSREQLEAMVLSMQSQSKRKLTMKVSKSGGMSVYGFGRWPTTLYRSQWEQLLDMADDIRAFLQINGHLMSSGKDDPRFAKEEN